MWSSSERPFDAGFAQGAQFASRAGDDLLQVRQADGIAEYGERACARGSWAVCLRGFDADRAGERAAVDEIRRVRPTNV